MSSSQERGFMLTHKSKHRGGGPSGSLYFPEKCRSDILSAILMPTNTTFPSPGHPSKDWT
jgi:hypothetical protein